MNWTNALERHDSTPEEQPRHGAGCDLDHLISVNPQVRIGRAGQFVEKGGEFLPY
jgi:hypothetical protein